MSRLIDPKVQHRNGFLGQQTTFGRRGGLARAAALDSRRRAEIAGMGGYRAGSHPPMPLSPRQVEMLRLLATGATNAEIAHRLNLREQSVKNALSVIYARLGVSNRTEAFAVFNAQASA